MQGDGFVVGFVGGGGVGVDQIVEVVYDACVVSRRVDAALDRKGYDVILLASF